jgi:hypothetical protein
MTVSASVHTKAARANPTPRHQTVQQVSPARTTSYSGTFSTFILYQGHIEGGQKFFLG